MGRVLFVSLQSQVGCAKERSEEASDARRHSGKGAPQDTTVANLTIRGAYRHHR